jgi:transketolase
MPNAELRREILRIANLTKEGHVPSSFSVLDILVSLFGGETSRGILKHDPKNPKDPARDRFILSKGHAALGYYAVLAHAGYFDMESLYESSGFCQPGSIYEGHPNTKIPGVEVNTGSLGHGLPMAVGTALALKIKHLQPPRVFCLVGDGELSEGSCWESVILAAHLKLDNLVVIVDANQSNPVKIGFSERQSIDEVFRVFGWWSYENHWYLDFRIPQESQKDSGRPLVVVCHTKKGHGCKPMEDAPEMWHHRIISDEELPALLAAIT